MNAKLILLSSEEAEPREILLDGERFTIGRKPENDLQLNRPEISGAHVTFVKQNEEYYVSDLGSTNGTLLNGARLVPRERYLLQHKDTITLGPYRISFELEADTASETMLETPEAPPMERVGSGTIIAQRVGTGTDEHRMINAMRGKQATVVETQAEGMRMQAVPPQQQAAAAQPPTPQPTSRQQPQAPPEPLPESPRPSPAPAMPAALPVEDIDEQPRVATKKGVDFVWLGLGALFLLSAIGMIVLLLMQL